MTASFQFRLLPLSKAASHLRTLQTNVDHDFSDAAALFHKAVEHGDYAGAKALQAMIADRWSQVLDSSARFKEPTVITAELAEALLRRRSMASRQVYTGGGVAPIEASSRTTRNRPARREADVLVEDKLAARLETVLGKVGQVRWWQRLQSWFWKPVNLEGSVYRLMQTIFANNGVNPYEHLSRGFFMHRRGNPATNRLLSLVNEMKPHEILELGAGDSNLARIMEEETGATVVETDLMPGPSERPNRHIVDFTKLPFSSNRFPVVLSSFAAEYEGLPAFKEAHRVMQRGGRLVALVHHKDSSIGFSHLHQKVIYQLSVGGYQIFGGSFVRHLIPNGLLEFWEASAKQFYHLRRAAFKSQRELRSMLERAGFEEVKIETAFAPPILFPDSPHNYDSGWIVTATKKK